MSSARVSGISLKMATIIINYITYNNNIILYVCVNKTVMLEENSDREGGDRNGERRSREIVKNHNVPNLSSAAGWSLKY